jgi:hypothetical protein
MGNITLPAVLASNPLVSERLCMGFVGCMSNDEVQVKDPVVKV